MTLRPKMHQVHQVPAYPNTPLIIFEIPIAITILIVFALVSFLLVSSLKFLWFFFLYQCSR